MPSRGQRSAAIANASCAASSARSKSPRKPISAARTRPHSSRKTAAGRCRSALHERPHLDRAGARRRDPRGDRDRVVEVRRPRAGRSPPSTSFVSANGPSVVSVSPFCDAHRRRGGARLQLRAAEDAGLSETCDVLARRSPARSSSRAALPLGVVAVDQECVLHDRPPWSCCRLYDEREPPKSTSALQERQRAGLVEHVVEVAALRALDARRAAVRARAAADHRRGVTHPALELRRSRAR